MIYKMACTILALSYLSCLAFAAEPPQDDSNSASQLSEPLHRFRRDLSRFIDDQRERGAYLGISTAPVPFALARQLGLRPGMGLVVEFVAKDSPAAVAGVRQYDVLQKLDEQLLVNAQQLAVLVRSFKPGDEVKLSLIRDGKPQTLTAKLIEHELEPLRLNQPFDGWELDPQFVVPPPHTSPRPIPPGQPYRSGKDAANSTLTWMDGDRSYSITTRNGHRSIAVKDKDDQTVFEGPLDTPEQRDRLPADIRDKVDKMTKSGLLAPNP